jgi:peptide/nickel transport system substrate-binding protein
VRHRYFAAVMTAIFLFAMALATGDSASATGGTPAGAATSPRHGGSVTDLVDLGQWSGLDPATNTEDAADESENNAIFGQLFELGANSAVVPDMATGYRIMDKGLQVDISLRPGIRFTDGSLLTAQVAQWNIERDLAPANACLCIADFVDVDSVTTKGKYTVVLNMKAPFSPIISAFVNEAPNWMVSEQSMNEMGEAAFAQRPVGAGPFEVVSNLPSERLTLKRNPGYWEKGRPYLDNLTFEVGGSDNADVDAIQSGQGQFSVLTTTSLVAAVQADAALKLFKSPAMTVEFVALNETVAPFKSLAAREALQYATDPKALVSSLYDNLYTPVESFAAPGMRFYRKTVPGFDAYDIAKASRLWQSIGAPQFDLDTSDTLFYVQESDALVQQWAAAGIKANVVIDTLPDKLDKESTNDWSAVTASWGSNDPGVALPIYFASDGMFSGTRDPVLDGLMNQGAQFVNPASRDKTYLKIDERLVSQAEAVFEYARPVLQVASAKLQGITPATDDLVQWQDVWLS